VEPHFEAHVDPCSAHSFGETNNPTFFQLRSDMRAVSCAQGDKFLVGSNGNFPLETWLEEQLGVKSFDGGWTVGTFCASLAYHLGCDPIIFIGMDFAASGGHTYAEGVEGGKAEKREAVINKQGDVVYAQLDWVLAAEWLEKLALAKTDRTWINATEGGLGFSGIDDKLFQDVIDSLGQCQVFTKPCLEIMPKGNFLETLEDSLARSFRIIDEIFKEIEKIYPRAPQESGRCALLEHELAQESGYHHVLSPIWEIWKGVILRYNQDGEAGIFLHQMLFYKNLQPKLCQYVSY
jgi:hypothetical protein